MRQAKYMMDNGLLLLAHGIVLSEWTARLGAGIYRSYNGHRIYHPSFMRQAVSVSVNLSPW